MAGLLGGGRVREDLLGELEDGWDGIVFGEDGDVARKVADGLDGVTGRHAKWESSEERIEIFFFDLGFLCVDGSPNGLLQ